MDIINDIHNYFVDPSNWLVIILVSFLLIISLGVILGYMKVIVVYKNFGDLRNVFLIVLLPMTVFFILMQLGIENFEAFHTPFYIFLAVILIYIFITTLKDNGNIFKALLAFVTKIPLGVLLVVALIEFISPKKRTNRGYAFATMLLLTPIVISLIHNKDNLPRVLRRFS